MRNLRKGLAVVAAAAAVVAAVAATASGSASERGQKKFVIGNVPPDLANPTLAAIDKGLKVQAKALGMEVVTAGGQFDPNSQIAAVDSLIQRRVDLIVIWPLDPNGIRPALDRARKAGIPFIVQESPKSKPYAANFSFNDTDALSWVAQYGASQIKKAGKPCKVGLILGVPVVEVLAARNRGLEQGAKKAGCQILAKAVNQTDVTAGAAPIISAWKTRFGKEMTGVFAYNDPSALAVVAASDSNFDPVVTGSNGDSLAIDAIRHGRMVATMGFPSVETGNGMAWVAYQILHKRKAPQNITALYERITKDNVGKYVTFEERLRKPMTVRFVKRGGLTILTATVQK